MLREGTALVAVGSALGVSGAFAMARIFAAYNELLARNLRDATTIHSSYAERRSCWPAVRDAGLLPAGAAGNADRSDGSIARRVKGGLAAA